MKIDEKKCPKCAETIKLEAAICRYCRHEFSKAELSQVSEKNARQAHTPSPKVKTFKNEEVRDKAIAAELTARAEIETITPSICAELGEVYNLTPRSIMARAVRLGLTHRFTDSGEEEGDEDNYDEVVDVLERTDINLQSATPNGMQYGVLQGPANLVGGCASLWGWAIVIFLVAGLFALMTGQIT